MAPTSGVSPTVTILVTGFAVCPIALYDLDASAKAAQTTTNGESHLSTALHDLDLGSMVDGFDPDIDSETVNPSSMIVSLLPNKLPSSPEYPTAINIISYPYPIRVSYEEVRTIIPKLHSHYSNHVDMILHLGMAPERPHFYVEGQARKDGSYHLPDVDGNTLDRGDAAMHWPDCPAVLHTSMDIDDVFNRWRNNLQTVPRGVAPELDRVQVERSKDAGHYLCNFMYYASLAEQYRKSKASADADAPLPVIFMHTPIRNSADDITKGGLVTKALLRALAESWADKRKRHSNR